MIKLLSTRKHLVQEVDAFGRYPAYYAVIKGNNACLAMMLDAGADAHKADQSGRRLASYGEQNYKISKFFSILWISCS